MNMDQFLGKYGYQSASLVIEQLAYCARLTAHEENIRKEALALASDLREALKSLEGKPLP